DLFSSLLAALVNQSSAYTLAGVVGGRMGNRPPSISPHDLMSPGDGALGLAVGNDRQFAALCQVLGAPGLAEDPRFVDNSRRVANREQLTAELEALLEAR